MPPPPLRLPLALSAERLQAGALTVVQALRPSWPRQRITFKVFTDGITNKLIGCSLDNSDEDTILVRIYGENTDLLIDRQAETKNFMVLNEAGYAPQLYATFENGIAYGFVPGKVLNQIMVKCPSIYPYIAKMMAKYHHIDCGPSVPKQPVLWTKMKHYLSLIPQKYSSTETNKKFYNYFPDGLEYLKKEILYLESQLCHLNNNVVFCHNDLLLANIIYDREKVTFIDYEYAAYNYQAYDIGNHFAEFAGVSEVDYSNYPSRDFQLEWLGIYMKEFKLHSNDESPVQEADVNLLYVHVNKFALASHLLWAAWALVQAQHSKINFDFMEYAKMRMDEYFSKKDIFLSLDIET